METFGPFPLGHKIITTPQAITFRKEKGWEEKEGIAPVIGDAKAFLTIFSWHLLRSLLLELCHMGTSGHKKNRACGSVSSQTPQ